MSDLKPIKLFSHVGTPNPIKVEAILLELSLPYDTVEIDMSAMKTPALEKYNPNGRVPAIQDPNNGDFVLWESGAIIEYLVDLYDPDGKISHREGNERWEEKQWLHFQMSGQGPYFGQSVWFQKYHPERIPSAVERYQKEALRVVRVRDTYLREHRQEYLVGNRCTYADLAFFPWDHLVFPFISGFEGNPAEEFPDFYAWHKKIAERPTVKKLLERMDAAMAARHKQ